MKIYIILILFHASMVVSSIFGFNSTTTENGNMKYKERERHALLTFKESVQDKYGMLSTWKEGPNEDCCKWNGVHCNTQTGYVQRLDLRGSFSKQLSGEINPSIAMLQYLKYLDLSYNELSGAIPFQLGNLTQLQHLDLSNNELSGAIPFQLGNLTQLQHLDLRYNKLSGAIPSHLGNLSLLQSLRLGYNSDLRINGQTQGNVEWLSNLSFLRNLQLSRVQNLNDSAHHTLLSIGKLPILEQLSLSECGLSDSNIPLLSDSHLNFSTSLTHLYLSHNQLTSSSMIFHWVFNYTSNLQVLYLNHNKLIGEIPMSIGSLTELEVLLLSDNSFEGRIPNLELNFTRSPIIDLSSNKLKGSIPSFLLQAGELHLSNNKFSDVDSFLCSKNNPNTLGIFDLSNNQLKGEIPDCWSSFNSLQYVNMSNNKLSGNIPFSMGTLVNMEVLILRNNTLSGQLTYSLKNCSNKLALLDLGDNMFHGQIPSWIGDSLQQLVILSLRSNNFFGNIPLNLCYLRKHQVLDLSANKLSGGIPTCVQNFTSIAQVNSTKSGVHWYFGRNMTFVTPYDYDVILKWKGVDRSLKNADVLLKSIDLSCNHLTGKIPTEIAYLFGLISLNLSRNNLSGEIVSNIGNLKSLDFLDLSRNHLSGRIPSSLTKIDGLGMLDLSNNQLYGKIPIGTQLQTFTVGFEGNSNLCGEPLDRKCPGEDPPKYQVPTTDDADDENSVFLEALYMSMGIGFFTGFVGLVGSVLFVPSWKESYSKFLNTLIMKAITWWKE